MVEYVERRLHRSALFISGATGPVEPWKLIKENLKISSSIVESLAAMLAGGRHVGQRR